MPQDAYTLRHIAGELDRMLSGGRVNKIIQPSRDEVRLLIYTGRRTVDLVLSASASDCGAYFLNGEAEAPLVAPNFCMLLRKYLQGAELLSCALWNMERILVFRFRGSTEFSTAERTLLLEVMGKYSNLVLLDEQGIILGALKMTSLDTSYKRLIFSGVKYAPPAPQETKVALSNEQAVRNVLRAPKGDLGDFLFTHIAGLAPVTAHQLAEGYRGGDLADYVLGEVFSDMVCPCVVEKDGVPVDFYARAVEGAIPFTTLSEAQTYCYSKKISQKNFVGKARRLGAVIQSAIKKQEKRLGQILEKKKECADCETLRLKGELLIANLYALQKGQKSCELANWYDPAGGTVKVLLDERLSPAENAQSYFKRYRKQKRTLEAVGPQEEETRAELLYLNGLSVMTARAETEEDLRSAEEELEAAGLLSAPQKRTKKREETSFRSYERLGFRIFAGRNNLQNDKLVRGGSPDDIWMHAQRYHSCHVLIKTEGKTVPAEVLQFAADICAKFSASRDDRVPVDYTLLKYVKKPKRSKPGFVTYTDFSTLAGHPDRA